MRRYPASRVPAILAATAEVAGVNAYLASFHARAVRRLQPGCDRPQGADVDAAVVPHSGHWIMEHNRQAMIDLVTGFRAK
jgi:hypothetical protein